MLVPGKKTLGWKDFGKALKTQWNDDKGSDFAASVTYYGLLAIFPFLLFIVALGGAILNPQKAAQLIQQVSTVAPKAATQIIGDRVNALMQSNHGSLLTVGVIGALWAASGGVVALMRALNTVYDVKEGRPFWKVRGIALGMTLFAGVFSVVSAIIMIAAGPVADGIGGPIGTLILWLRWPVAALLMMMIWAVCYYVLPDVQQRFHFLTFGSLVGVITWLVASWGFSEYVSHFGKYEATYGTLGGVIVLLIWMYLSSSVMLLGAEMNAVLEQASPEGKRPGAKSMKDTGTEPVPGAKGVMDKRERGISHAGDRGGQVEAGGSGEERESGDRGDRRGSEDRSDRRGADEGRNRGERPGSGREWGFDGEKHWFGGRPERETGRARPGDGAFGAAPLRPASTDRRIPEKAPAAAVARDRRVKVRARPAWLQAITVGLAAGLAGFLYTRRA